MNEDEIKLRLRIRELEVQYDLKREELIQKQLELAELEHAMRKAGIKIGS